MRKEMVVMFYGKLNKFKKFSWLHLSDLHFGQQSQWLWPNFREIFLKDLCRLSNEAGPLDLVIFSGDLTQRGEKSQFESLTRELAEIWEELDKLGQRPQLFTVPGNHDLVRPSEKDARLKMLTRWDSDPEVVNEFWNEPDNQYLDLVRAAFANYIAWQEEICTAGIPLAPFQKGLLPGDTAASLILNQISVGLIGLNSSFLQLHGGEFRERLALDLRQLNAVAGGDAPVWCDKHEVNFLITHHPVSWLSNDAQREFQTEIYPSGRFTAHLFGHMHDADLSTLYRGGDSGRKSFQSSSLFGMEYLADGKTERVHGYSIGQISVGSEKNTWKLWPRRATVNRKSRDRKLIPDHENFEIVPGQEYQIEQLVNRASFSSSTVVASPRTYDLAVAVEVSAPQWNNALRGSLYSLAEQTHHLAIRRLEQQSCIESIRQKKIAWVCADWGLGRDGFLWSVAKQLGRDAQPVYRLALGAYRTRDEFLTHFATLSGCSFPEFCKALAAAGPATLLLDDAPISDADHIGMAIERDVESLAGMVRDFCPDIVIFLLARTTPRDHKIDVVTLDSLDEADTRTYLMAHPSANSESISSHAVNVIHRRTDGLPAKIDATLKTLRVVNLSELGPPISVEPTAIATPHESIPLSLVKAVSELIESKDPSSKRAYFLLKVLAVLPHGESLQRLKHIDNRYPIFAQHAEELLDRDLIQVRSSPTLIGNHEGDDERVKLLVAPRPVRDYVLLRMSSREIDVIVQQAIVLYFGENWRAGSASLKKLGGSLTSDDGSLMENPHTIVMRMLNNTSTWEQSDGATAILNLCNIYCTALHTGRHYRNCVTVCRDVLSVVPELGYKVHRDSIKALLAKSLRMTGDHGGARPLFEQLLEKDQSKANKADLALAYALCLQSLNDEGSIAAAQTVVELVPGKAQALQAEALIVEVAQDVDHRNKLLHIERQARKLGYNTVANNLALDRIENNEDYSSLRIVHSTALEAGDAYTAARAVVKISALSFKESGTLSSTDLNNLINAYQYFYGERFGTLFSKAHEALWEYFSSRGDVRNLLSLFRHSSFIWRLHDSENKEQIYVRQLIDNARQILSTDILTADKNTAYFLLRARNEKAGNDA